MRPDTGPRRASPRGREEGRKEGRSGRGPQETAHLPRRTGRRPRPSLPLGPGPRPTRRRRPRRGRLSRGREPRSNLFFQAGDPGARRGREEGSARRARSGGLCLLQLRAGGAGGQGQARPKRAARGPRLAGLAAPPPGLGPAPARGPPGSAAWPPRRRAGPRSHPRRRPLPVPSSARSRWRRAARPGCRTASCRPRSPWRPAGRRSGRKAASGRSGGAAAQAEETARGKRRRGCTLTRRTACRDVTARSRPLRRRPLGSGV